MKIKGYNFREIIIRDSYNRRAQQFKNKIINNLKEFGLTSDDIEIPLESMAIKKAEAVVTWYMWDEHLFFSYNHSNKFVENLAMAAQVIKHFLYLLDKKEITREEFLHAFKEDKDIIEQRRNAREVLGVDEDCLDFDLIHEHYKKLSKKYHPDMPTGDTEKFKEINVAHKILKKELN